MDIPKHVASSVDGREFQLIVLPTEKCNFRCVYCYEDFKIGKMTPETVRGLKRLLSRRLETIQHLNVSWFGGEPLLAMDIIEDVSTFIQDRIAGRDIRYAGSMTTNGYFLDSRKFDLLVRLGVNDYQISLDGDAEAHDTTRVRRDGKPTFDTIWRNLESIRAADVDARILIRLHVMRTNIDSAARFVTRLDESFGADPRFSLVIKPVGQYGGASDRDLPILTDEEEREIVAALYKRAQRLVLLKVDGSNFENYVCYAAKANSLIIRANGTVAKCTVALNDERNSVGQLREDGTIAFKNDRLQRWLEPLTTRKAEDLACPYSALRRASTKAIEPRAS